MAITSTTTSAAFSATDQFVTLTSATGLTNAMWIKVDGEYMGVRRDYGTAPYTSTQVPVVRRGDLGTAVVAHNTLAPASFGLYTELAAYSPTQLTPTNEPALATDIVTVSTNSTLAAPTRDTLYVLDKASALSATTLGAPGKDQDGLAITLTSTTNAAHVITATSLINDGATGAPHTTLTFAAFKGAGIRLRALQGLWQVESNNIVTVS